MFKVTPEALFAFQVAVIVLAAKGFGRVFEKYLKQPSVTGEILAGVVIGPFALGGLHLPGVGPLFPLTNESLGPGLNSLSAVAAVTLLFLAGLETDLAKFLRFAGAGLVIGLGGALLSFVLGDLAMVWLGGAGSFMAPSALMMGAVSTATSVGLTARVLSDAKKMDTPEGATILAAAVVDDVIGLVILSVVVALTSAGATAGHAGISWEKLLIVVLTGGLFWVVFLALGVGLSRRIVTFVRSFGSIEAVSAAGLGLALLLGGLSESFGLALIVGAYIMGLSLSKADMRHEITRGVTPIYELLVPVFFCMTGMTVNLAKVPSVLLLGLVFTALCVIGKIIGCGLPAIPMGFNLRGAARIGLGMVPRQEVGLIVASLAVSRGVLGNDAMGAVILMILVTGVGTPMVLARVFDSRRGHKGAPEPAPGDSARLRIPLPRHDLAVLVMERILKAFREEGFYAYRLPTAADSYELRKDDYAVFVGADEGALVITARSAAMQYARFIVLEEFLALEQIFREAAQLPGAADLKRSLLEMHPEAGGGGRP